MKGREATVSTSPLLLYYSSNKTNIYEKRTNPSAGFLQASILPETCLPPPRRGAHADVKGRSMRSGKCRIYEADKLAYTRRPTSHIRSKKRRICETGSLEYTKQSAPNMRALTTARQVSDEDTGGRDNPFIINLINESDYECKV